jgi:hypothetical protein
MVVVGGGGTMRDKGRQGMTVIATHDQFGLCSTYPVPFTNIIATLAMDGPLTNSFFDDILKPGSTLQSSFLRVLDCAFAFLLVVLLSLAYLTSGNLHLFALVAIELCVWASVKW